LLVGAGGAGAAISIALADAGVQRLRIVDLDQAKV
jgi:shikimate dehydrogenase